MLVTRVGTARSLMIELTMRCRTVAEAASRLWAICTCVPAKTAEVDSAAASAGVAGKGGLQRVEFSGARNSMA